MSSELSGKLLTDALIKKPKAVRKAIDKMLCERTLVDFVKVFWPEIEPANELVYGWSLDAICEHLEAVTYGDIKRLLINVPPGFMKSLLCNVFWPAWEWGPIGLTSNRFIAASYSQNLTIRDNIKFRNIIMSDLYREYWGETVVPDPSVFTTIKVQNTKTGWKIASSVTGTITGERGDRFVIDDPNAVNEVESESVRTSTNTWFRETVPTRLNKQDESAIVVVQQRVHEVDVTGTILDLGLPYDMLMIPMEYDSARHCSTRIGWNDPRGLDEDGELLVGKDLDAADGALAWPERFPKRSVESLKTTLGPYACTPAESPVLMSDLSLRAISDVRVGDEVIGFTMDSQYDQEAGRAAKRRHLVKSKVVQVHRYVAPVVKITLDSGAVIRCTPDHKWYRGKQGGQRGKGDFRPQYREARVGSALMRVCPVNFPELTPEQERIAGWVAGFFDGEGSVSLMNKAAVGHRSSAVIAFYQGGGRNLPLCEKLEESLTALGFNFALRKVMRLEKNGGAYPYHQYVLTGSFDLPVKQRFLEIVKPIKWRDRISDGALGAKFIVGQEKVVSIDDDGAEDVFALETETGNYVVWGFASSNSAGQLQQQPSPRGGGIFKIDWWKQWPPEDWPDEAQARAKNQTPVYSYVVASLDCALTQDQENDFTALTIWGVWKTPDSVASVRRMSFDNDGFSRVTQVESPKIMLIWGWQKRLGLHGPPEHKPDYMTDDQWNSPWSIAKRKENWGIAETVAHDCRLFQVDHLLIENKAGAQHVIRELQGMLSKWDFSSELVDPGRQDKVARAHSVVHLFSNDLVYAPRGKQWCDDIVFQAARFPRGKNDDLVDSMTQALQHLRDTRWAVRREETQHDYEEELSAPLRSQRLYDT